MELTYTLFGPFDGVVLAQATIRIIAAIILGGIIGYDREKAKRPAGFRSHILLCLGTMSFVMVPVLSEMDQEAISRVLQGIGTLVGALALGSVLKRDDKQVTGVTTAMTAIPTAAIGVTIGMGHIALAIMLTVATFFVLRLFIFKE